MKTIRRFVWLGAVSTLVDYAVYSLLINAGVDYVFAIVTGYGVGLVTNFWLGRRYVFTSGVKVKSGHAEFLSVSAIAFVGMLINIAIVKLFSYSVWQIDPMLSRVVGIVAAFFWNFFARKRFVYH